MYIVYSFDFRQEMLRKRNNEKMYEFVKIRFLADESLLYGHWPMMLLSSCAPDRWNNILYVFMYYLFIHTTHKHTHTHIISALLYYFFVVLAMTQWMTQFG